MNPVIDNIIKRRSIRKFSEKELKREDLEKIAQCAIYAPSGLNRQSWQFTILNNKKKLKELSLLARDFFRNIKISENSPTIYSRFKSRAKNDDFSFFYHAPALIITSNDSANYSGIADCSAAMQNIMLAAHSLAIGSCWINTLLNISKEEIFRNYLSDLGIPKNHTVYGTVALGYADESPSAPERKEEAIHWAE